MPYLHTMHAGANTHYNPSANSSNDCVPYFGGNFGPKNTAKILSPKYKIKGLRLSFGALIQNVFFVGN
jgi:hypothetical protein